jgi:hypothetical protein
METLLWAVRNRQTNRVPQLFVVEPWVDPQDAENALGHIIPPEAADRMSNVQVDLLEEQPGQNSDLWIVVESLNDPGGATRSSRVLLRPTDSGWRMVIGTNDNGNVDPVEETITNQP